MMAEATGTVPETNGESRGSHVNGVITRDNELHVIVVGAGIGGLTAAIALRQQGHRVTVYERSRFANELGAALHLAPNANGILRRYGIPAEALGANLMERLIEYATDGSVARSVELREPNKLWQHPWLLANRINLHNTLRSFATSPDGKGTPVILHTSSRVIGADPDAATIELDSGEKITGDVVIGADGVHSALRKNGVGRSERPFSSGKNAYRFLIKKAVALSDSRCAPLVAKDGELAIWYGSDRRVVMYPCVDNTLLNFVCIHPEELSDTGDDAWSTQGSLDQLLKVYEGFDAGLIALLSKANVDTLKSWKLLDMADLPTWVNGHVALLGDAAHPFLPHQGQGGGMAIEDAASLGVVLQKPITRDEITDRLKLYERCRIERAQKIQQYTRDVGRVGEKDAKQIDMMEYTNYNFGHDEIDYSTQMFNNWLIERYPHRYWRMPIGFGPAPGPRQTVDGKPRPSLQSTFRTASIRFTTSRTLLQTLFPTPAYSFTSPGSVAYASISATQLDKMDWLGGNGYNHVGLYIHGVKYTKQDGSVISGTHLPVLFESLTDPIVSGREELGMPKLFCDVNIYRRSTSYRLEASWRNARFCDFLLDGLEEDDAKSEGGTIGGTDDAGILTYKYIPAVGYEGRNRKNADAAYPVFVSHSIDSSRVPSKVTKVYRAQKAEVSFRGLDWEALPTLHHVASFLERMPIYEVVEGKIVEGTGVPNVSAAARIE